ncbi:hypothetical protein EDD37DRAFT_629371 [Exophiala viscosa]|uniref:uncharacterized protein n=1 Tax=Exophiala viscosa TaxID=2486360 RepID=UPI00219A6761|nr:hypothetical protein EDD37DRAFT_629371 [Exophiala viscosa]
MDPLGPIAVAQPCPYFLFNPILPYVGGYQCCITAIRRAIYLEIYNPDQFLERRFYCERVIHHSILYGRNLVRSIRAYILRSIHAVRTKTSQNLTAIQRWQITIIYPHRMRYQRGPLLPFDVAATPTKPLGLRALCSMRQAEPGPRWAASQSTRCITAHNQHVPRNHHPPLAGTGACPQQELGHQARPRHLEQCPRKGCGKRMLTHSRRVEDRQADRQNSARLLRRGSLGSSRNAQSWRGSVVASLWWWPC